MLDGTKPLMRCIVLGLRAQLWVKAKNCTVSRIKHTHLAHLGPEPGPKPLGEAASAGGIGGFKELLTFLGGGGASLGQGNKVYICPVALKLQLGRVRRWDAPQLGPGARREECRAVWRLCPAQGGRQHKGALPVARDAPSLEDTGDHDKNNSIIFLLSGIVTKLFTPAPHLQRETSAQF